MMVVTVTVALKIKAATIYRGHTAFQTMCKMLCMNCEKLR